MSVNNFAMRASEYSARVKHMETEKAEKILADIGELIQNNQHLEGALNSREQEVQQLRMRVQDLQFQLASQENYYRGWLRRNIRYEDARMTMEKEKLNVRKEERRKEGFFSKIWRRINSWGS